MRLARRALFAALAMWMLCATASVQVLRPETGLRGSTVYMNISQSRPTGFFTVYKGQTLRHGEFTFSMAYTNFDRDPDDDFINDIRDDHRELARTARLTVRNDNPRNLSSFYLSNSPLSFPELGSGAAIILAPTRLNVGTVRGAVFRPAFNQPFVQFPFIGTSASKSGITSGDRGGDSRLLGFNATWEPPFEMTTGGSFAHADIFQGAGLDAGSILLGVDIVTSTSPTHVTQLGSVPATFTIAPTRVSSVLLVNCLHDESCFTNFAAGVKSGQTSAHNSFDIGNFGLVFFAKDRLTRPVNVSANLAHVMNGGQNQ